MSDLRNAIARIGWRKLKRDDLRNVCFHEAGHYTVASHFFLPAGIEIVPLGKKPTLESRAFAGRVNLYQPTTCFRHAVICWAGPIAEAAISDEGTEESIRWLLADPDWLSFQMDWIGDGEDMSPTDRAGMFMHHQVWRAAKTAAQILFRKFAELERVAHTLMDTTPCE